MRLLNDLGARLGKAMLLLIHLLDPELIVLGGGLAADAGQLLLPIIRKAVYDGVLPLTATARKETRAVHAGSAPDPTTWW